MKFLNKGISLQQLKHTLPLFLALIVAGLAGNYFKFPIKATAAGGAIPVTAITASAFEDDFEQVMATGIERLTKAGTVVEV